MRQKGIQLTAAKQADIIHLVCGQIYTDQTGRKYGAPVYRSVRTKGYPKDLKWLAVVSDAQARLASGSWIFEQQYSIRTDGDPRTVLQRVVVQPGNVLFRVDLMDSKTGKRKQPIADTRIDFAVDAEIWLCRVRNLRISRKNFAHLAGMRIKDGYIRFCSANADVKVAIVSVNDPAAILLGGVHPTEIRKFCGGGIVTDKAALRIRNAVEFGVRAEGRIPNVFFAGAGPSEVDDASRSRVEAHKVRMWQRAEIHIAIRRDSQVTSAELSRDWIMEVLRRAVSRIDRDHIEGDVIVEIACVDALRGRRRTWSDSGSHEAAQRAIARDVLEAAGTLSLRGASRKSCDHSAEHGRPNQNFHACSLRAKAVST